VGKESIMKGRNVENKFRARASAFLKVIALELVVSVIMLIVGHLTGNRYFSGVGIGLTIAWVTGALAYWKVGRGK
jgi:hypothetical protein